MILRFHRTDESEERQEEEGCTGGTLSTIPDWSEHESTYRRSMRRHGMAHRRCVLRDVQPVESAKAILDPEQAHGVQYDLDNRQRDRDRSDRSTDKHKSEEKSKGDVKGCLR